MKPWLRQSQTVSSRAREFLSTSLLTTLGPALALALVTTNKSVSAPSEADQPVQSQATLSPAGDESLPTPPEESGFKSFIRSIAPSLFEDSADQSAEPTSMESDAGNLGNPLELLSESELAQASPWHPTDFGGQAAMLGWSENVFDVPLGLEERVEFWREIYTKYTVNQGVLHDRDNFKIIYEPVDFGAIMADQTKTVFQKARAREKYVKERRKEIVERLNRLHKTKSAQELSGEDLRLWKMFEAVQGKDKFKEAAKRGRVRFQLGQRDRFIVGIYHSGRYLRQMEKIFRDEGLPIELTRLPFVESSFNIHARSRVGASGVWQFMRRTARPYLKMNQEVDERNDPLRAARASAKLLKSNFALLQNWPLAVTGYNHGPNGVHKIARKLRTRDIGQIVNTYSSRRFGFASENFYACFLAALEIEKNAQKYFGEVKWGPELSAVEVKLRNPLPYKSIVEFFDGDSAAADLANPHLLIRVRKGHAPVPKGMFVRVPSPRLRIVEDLQQMANNQASKFLLDGLTTALREAPLVPSLVPSLGPPASAATVPAVLPSTAPESELKVDEKTSN